MTKNGLNTKTYFELTEHNKIQLVVFFTITAILTIITFYFSLPFQLDIFRSFLLAEVHTSGDALPYSFNYQDFLRQPNYYFSWAVDFDAKSSSPYRFWYNPAQSVILICGLLSITISAVVTSFLPRQFGFMRQKIEREIANLIDKLSIHKYGYYGKEEQIEIMNEIVNADLRELHEMSSESIMSLEDLKTLRKALLWLQAPIYMKILKVNDGLKMYMRFYFTVQYANTMLGLVYIGAAVLIITIGLRGIKFIPPTQPSYVLFALGLEFTLLLVFAVTTIYQRQDDEHESEASSSAASSGNKYQGIGKDYGTAKEIENLLRVFIKSKKN